jgi:hydroxymethylpyrimidine kinase/phosphomethylpyrimidine kinase/thiamine-phosphate diphosphorylase
MLFSATIISTLAEILEEYRKRIVVVDPVMVAKGGASLIDQDALSIFKEQLLPMAYLLTPNIPEAEKLTGMSIVNEGEMQAASQELYRMGAANVLLKGGHLADGMAVDILYNGTEFYRFASPRVMTRNTHGTGCTYASAISAFLAGGEPLPKAISRAKEYITAAIRHAVPLGKGHGPVNHFKAAEEITKAQGSKLKD